MKLAYIDLCGFRGYRKAVRIDFANNLTVIDGRNGVGKSTVFDAIEFALTGTIAKYNEAKADGESVADYIWWTGNGVVAGEKYVEVGFRDDFGEVISLRRSQLGGVDENSLQGLVQRLCDPAMMPRSPLPQLCTASIIRDEQIAALSVDLKEADRYQLIREAIGATDAEVWIDRSSKIVATAKKNVQSAANSVVAAADRVSGAAKRIDEIRASLAEESTIAAATERLRSETKRFGAPDELIDPARSLVAETKRRLSALEKLSTTWAERDTFSSTLTLRSQALQEAEQRYLEKLSALDVATTATAAEDVDLLRQARDLAALLVAGRRVGRMEDCCPLCGQEQTEEVFQSGLAKAEQLVARLDEQALERERKTQARMAAQEEVESARRMIEEAKKALDAALERSKDFGDLLLQAEVSSGVELSDVQQLLQAEAQRLARVVEDLGVLETLRFNSTLERAMAEEAEAKNEYSRAEKRLGVLRLAESRAQTLHDSARRAAGETLDRRLERVLPLMSELYKRLRPHPLWGDIDYKIRGDVRRFMTLQVGSELNPQFMFSSGQRRATGLAFLMAVNLSLAWSRWRTLLLDDPVQHIDDFRSVHLAEVLAQISATGRQIICAVEDQALADLLCRRLPISADGDGRRLTLGVDSDGDLARIEESSLIPLVQGVLVSAPNRLAG